MKFKLRKKNTKTSSIIMTALFTGAAGAIAGILFAPEKGSNTRSKLARKGKLYNDYLVDKFHDLADSVSHPFEGLEDQAIRLSKKAVNKGKMIKDEALQH